MGNTAWMGSKYDFIKVPKKLILERESYKDLDSDSIFLYAYLFTKSQQSYSNKQYHDSYGVYVVDNFRQLFNWGKHVSADRLKQLETLNLIEIRTSKMHAARRIYVKDFNSTAPVTKYFSSQSIYNLQFFSIPTSLLFDDAFINLSTDAVLLYGVLLDFLSMSKLDDKSSYYDSDLDAYYLTKKHDYFTELFGWSSAKYSRIQKVLVDNSLIRIVRVGKNQRNRLYPIDVLSFALSKTKEGNPPKGGIYHSVERDLSKSGTEKPSKIADLSKFTEGFIKIGQGIYQNRARDLSKSDTNRLSLSTLSPNRLNTSNQYKNELIEDNNSSTISFLKNGSIGLIEKENVVSNLIYDLLSNKFPPEQVEEFVEMQCNFSLNRIKMLELIEESKNDSAWYNYYKEALDIFNIVYSVLLKVYTKDPEVLAIVKNLNISTLSVGKKLSKLNSKDICSSVERVVSYFDKTHTPIENKVPFILKTLITASSYIPISRVHEETDFLLVDLF